MVLAHDSQPIFLLYIRCCKSVIVGRCAVSVLVAFGHVICKTLLIQIPHESNGNPFDRNGL